MGGKIGGRTEGIINLRVKMDRWRKDLRDIKKDRRKKDLRIKKARRKKDLKIKKARWKKERRNI